MRRDHSAWLLAGPLVAAAALVAHALAYRLAGSDPQIAAHDSAHHYLSHLPALAAPAIVVALLALTVRLARARRGETLSPLPRAPLALVPAPVFALQECLEQLAHSGGIDPALVARPTFVLGVALATPLALAGLALARGLLASTDRVANAAARTRVDVPPAAAGSTPVAAAAARALRPSALARPTGRAPPAAVAA